MQNTILVADSDTQMQLLLFRLFAEAGYVVTSASDAAEVIARIEAERPNLIVANADLPGKSGVELCRLVKAQAQPIPIVLLAPGTDPAPIEAADAVIGIPIDAQRALDAVGRLLAADQAQQPKTPVRILVIDDDLGILNLLDNLLTNEGYKVTTADCGRDGLAALERERPDLVLLDVQMPGLSGFEVLSTIRQQHGNLPVIMVTGYGSEDVATQSLRLGADDYLSKPLRIRNICFRIETNLERARFRTSQERLNRLLRQTTLDLTDRLQKVIEARAGFRDLLSRVLEDLRYRLEGGGSVPEAIGVLNRLREMVQADPTGAAYKEIAEGFKEAGRP